MTILDDFKDDLNLFLDLALSQGCDLLEKEGYFYPYALALEQDGGIMRSPQFVEDLTPEQIGEELKQQLSLDLERKKYLAVAIGLSVKVQKNESEAYEKAINIWLRSQDGKTYDIFLPYTQEEDRFIWKKVFSQSLND